MESKDLNDLKHDADVISNLYSVVKNIDENIVQNDIQQFDSLKNVSNIWFKSGDM